MNFASRISCFALIALMGAFGVISAAPVIQHRLDAALFPVEYLPAAPPCVVLDRAAGAIPNQKEKENEMKKRVKMLDSIAGLSDPRPKEDLDAKYERIRIANKTQTQRKPLSDQTIEAQIAELKRTDRYGEVPIGFSKDWAFKPGDEPLINAKLAEKWEASGICVAIPDAKAA